ncbi:amino acid/amide ABC transporter substrate-binding protein (HAAT family) [Humibacillus xanthopallidus]|uniref:Amino acid/amide ABC transporter substrate-binding protein (HAAT family) n=1 Tax=Humibacillus xanthopallidus TaxID=412689 RepID=A0A543PRW5_9MICO|nr:ABC transporter substrate-binding protein [Humibacillus xanthopallidus]TQN46818.1 amino acid/amide ABC transporter substrate-binding protein (HAAT family) [Humibacillus xanthopallidus]
MKRFLRVVSAAALPALVLGACGSGTGTGTGGDPAAASTGGAASAAASVVNADDCADPEGAKAPITGTLKVGWSAPTSGPLADAVGNVIEGMKARFAVENAKGGIGGVKLEVVVKDDAFNPERAKANVGELIQKEGVHVLETFGSGQVDAIADDQNDACVPLLFAQASVPAYRDIEKFPWTTEYLPSADVEMGVVVESLKKKYPNGAKIALAANQTESGQGIANGLKKAIEGTGFTIAAEAPLTDPRTAASSLKSSGAPILVNAGVTTDCLALTQAIGRVGWKPETVIQPSNCADGATLYAPAGDAADGQQILRWLKDPANAAFADDAAVKEYLQLSAANGADSPTNSYTVNGWAIADLMVDDFTRAAKLEGGLSRVSIMQAARTQNYQPPMFIDGISFTMSPTQAYGVLAFQPFTWKAADKAFAVGGDVIDISSQYDK